MKQVFEEMSNTELIALFDAYLDSQKYGSLPVPIIKLGAILNQQYPDFPAHAIFQMEIDLLLQEIGKRFKEMVNDSSN